MDKIGMREWVSDFESVVDTKLKKWRKIPKVENGEAVQLAWQWEQTRIVINIFWEDNKELIRMEYTTPRLHHNYNWHGLNDKSFDKAMDRVGNLAQVTMHPPIGSQD